MPLRRAAAMAPRYQNRTQLTKDGAVLEQLRVVGLALEHFLYLGLGRPRHGLNALTGADVAEVDVFGVKSVQTGVEHRVAALSVEPADAELALATARSVVVGLEGMGLRVLDALPSGLPGRADHDLVVERTGARGRGSVEVKLMQIGAPSALETARARERAAAAASNCWAGAPKGPRGGFVERFLAMWVCEPQFAGGTLAQRLAKGKLRVDVMRCGPGGQWTWTPFSGWAGFNLGNSAAPPAPPPLRPLPPRASSAPPAQRAPPPSAARRVPPPSAAPPGGAARPWPQIRDEFAPRDRTQRRGRGFLSMSRLCYLLGRLSWMAHISREWPRWRREFGWGGDDCFQQRSQAPYDRGGPPKYWVSHAAAQRFYERYS